MMTPLAKNTPEFRTYLSNYKSRDNVPAICPGCKIRFMRPKNVFQMRLARNLSHTYCSKKCSIISAQSRIDTTCTQCGQIFQKIPSQIKENRKNFCNNQCRAIYQNTHKTSGYRRSKFECYLEDKIKYLWPTLRMETNTRIDGGLELDFYFPDLRLAIEINGIVHYEPIYGKDKFNRIRDNDKQKMLKCGDKGIELCVVNISHIKYWSTAKFEEYSKDVMEIIKSVMNRQINL